MSHLNEIQKPTRFTIVKIDNETVGTMYPKRGENVKYLYRELHILNNRQIKWVHIYEDHKSTHLYENEELVNKIKNKINEERITNTYENYVNHE